MGAKNERMAGELILFLARWNSLSKAIPKI